MEGREALGANAGLVAMPIRRRHLDRARRQRSASRRPSRRAGSASRRVAHADRRRLLTRTGDLPRRRRARASATRPMTHVACSTASVPLRADGPVLGALGFRFERDTASASPSVRSRRRSPSTAPTRSSEHACTTPSAARGRHSRVLASIGEHLARSLEPDAALRTLAELAVPAIADQCVVDLVRGDRIERRALVHADPALQEAARTLEQFAPDIASDTPVAVAIREGTDAARPRDAGSAGQRVPERGTIARGARDPAALDADGAPDRPRPHARRAHVRLEARARVRPRGRRARRAAGAARRPRDRQRCALPGGAWRARAAQRAACASCRSAS